MVFSLESAASNSPKSTTRTQRKPASGEKAIQEAGGYRIGTMPSATQRDTQKSIIDRASGAALKSDVSKGGKDIFERCKFEVPNGPGNKNFSRCCWWNSHAGTDARYILRADSKL